MIIDKDELISELNLKPFGQKGWMKTDDVCPFCGKGEKNAILFTENNSAIYHCFKCGEKTSIQQYLRSINRKDLIHSGYEVSGKETRLLLIRDEDELEQSVEIKDTSLPRKLERLVADKYLDDRHFLPMHYDEFEPSRTKSFLEGDLMKYDYIIFKLKQQDHVVAWLARTRFDKKWHETNLKQHKAKKTKLVLRYKNSEDGFSHVLGGYNFIGEKTDTVILVEGLFDKVNVDYLMQLTPGGDIACCFTFGKKISFGQLNLLIETNVKNIFLMYDEDALKESKENSIRLSKHFNVRVCRIKDKDIDPGNMDAQYLYDVLSRAEDPINFRLSNIENALCMNTKKINIVPI